MLENTKVSRAIKLALFASAVSLPTTSAFAEESMAEEETVEKIRVTGSRIARSELSQPTPILSIDAAQIARFGNPDLGSILAELPAIGATDTVIGNNNTNSDAGLSSADLRRLGANRTLVLVNGKRHVAGAPGSAQVDLATIPAALIERVEIITGGASAVYGSDAVSGVVNVILKDNFEGFEFSTTGGRSTEGVGTDNHTFNLIAGGDIADGRGNITVYAGVERFKETMSRDLQQLDNWGTIANPANTGEDDGISDRLRVPNVGSELINANGVLDYSNDTRITFDDNGNRMDTCVRDGDNSYAFGYFENGCDSAYYGENQENYSPSVDRTSAGATFNYDITENMTFFSDFKYTKSEIKQQYQPGFRFGNIDINIADNAFLSDDVRAEFGDRDTVSMAKFFTEIGNRSAKNERELFRYVAGINGVMSLSKTDIDYELFYTFGETTNTRVTENDIIPGNVAAAIDSVIDPATGNAVCRSQLESAQGEDYTNPATVDAANCIAYNPFGFAQSSQEAMDWVSADVTRNDKITQEVYGGSLAFDTEEWFSLQGGPVGIAAGFEYRKEESETLTDSLTQSGALAGAATPDSFGKYDVNEVFMELSLPLLADMPFAHELTIDAAYRYADYSHAGTADAWKLGFMYAPIADLRLRATHGAAVRAPNLDEAFSPQSPGFSNIDDPCDADQITDDADRAANCAALGIPSGFEANDNVSIDIVSGGNPDLTSEESKSTTVGFVWTPEFISGLSVTMDYYKIEIEDAIIEVDSQDIINNCVDATGGLDPAYCSAVDRDPTTHDITMARSGFLNAAALNTAGIESEIRYNMGLGQFGYTGDLRFQFFASKLLKMEQFEFQDRPDEINDNLGEVNSDGADPEWQFRLSTTYNLDDLSINWTARYIDRMVTYDVSNTGGSPEDLNPGWVPSQTTHDLSFNYQVSDNVSVNAGMRNMFNKIPPAYNVDAIYDLVGRRVYAGVKVNFD